MESPSELQLDLEEVLRFYTDVFDKPKGLPPMRTHDHHFPLLANVVRVII